MGRDAYTVSSGEGPILATAIHNGHDVRPELSDLLALSEDERLREEDPFTGRWTYISPNRIILNRSRFEFDLNRPREKAVYIKPEDAWGLNVWKSPPEDATVETSLAHYDRFYEDLRVALTELETRYGGFVVYDIHSYNHRRNGPEEEPEDPMANPEVNLGTGSMDREFWAPVADVFMDCMSRFDFSGRNLDVRENVKFKGGWLSQWVHRNFPRTGCCLAVEFKKIYMDEWTGEPFEERIELIRRALDMTVKPVGEGLDEVLATA